jgi:plastocyanin
MTPLLQSNLEGTHPMLASPIQHQKYSARDSFAISPILKHLNTRTLAFAMFIALALLSSTHGKDSQTKESIFAKAKTEVTIDNFSFSPNTLTLPAGATVTWTNRDTLPHVVSSADNQFKKSTVLKTGQSFSDTFGTSGTYSYFCSIHPRMTGKIIIK